MKLQNLDMWGKVGRETKKRKASDSKFPKVPSSPFPQDSRRFLEHHLLLFDQYPTLVDVNSWVRIVLLDTICKAI